MTGLVPGSEVIQTFAALLLAHVLADFVFQTAGMVARKRAPGIFALHIAIVAATTLAALGGAAEIALIVAGLHLVIDAVKTYLLPASIRSSFTAFAGDQLAHLASLVAVALLWPGIAPSGLWAPLLPWLTGPALALSGFVLCVFAGGHAVGLLTRRFEGEIAPPDNDGLRHAGRLIGQLERSLIFLLVAIGQPAGIGFLIAAKSILRYDTAAQQKLGEYVIIGTLASFTWAIAMAYATFWALEIAAANP